MTRLVNALEQPVLVSPASDAGLTLEVRAASERLFALGEWQSLESRLNDVPLACSFDWTAAWLDAFGDLAPHWFVLAKDAASAQTLGICLVTRGVQQKDGPVAVRSLHLGTAGEPDTDSVCVEYNDLLVVPEARLRFCHLLRQHFESHAGVDQWQLDGIDESLAEAFSADNDVPLKRRTETACWFDLTEPRNSGKPLSESLRSSTRRKVRRSLEAYPDLTVDWSESLAEATEAFEDLITLHQARWNAVGEPGCYASERFMRFHESLLTRLVPQRRMFFVRVRSGHDTVGCVQLFNDRNRILLYQCGWSPAADGMSPGVVVDYLAMDACLQRGFDAYNFLGFETQHKRHLSNRCSSLIWMQRRRPRLKFAALSAARQLKQKLTSGDRKHES
jgi:hypothetical protein